MSQIQTIKSSEELAQEQEILLSYDFEAMSLDELKKVESEYRNLKQQYDKLVPSWTGKQYEAWQWLYYWIEKREHENERVKVGDLFYSSWGYDQTNSEFFKVVSISKTGKTCEIVQVMREFIGDDKTNQRNMSGQVIPTPDKEFDKPPLKVKVERSHTKNPWTNKSDPIGKIQLRGSVYYGNNETSTSKHLETLYRVDGPVSISWYA